MTLFYVISQHTGDLGLAHDCDGLSRITTSPAKRCRLTYLRWSLWLEYLDGPFAFERIALLSQVRSISMLKRYRLSIGAQF
jgi:hypothetical protein